jgi:signal transduction histidine kinase
MEINPVHLLNHQIIRDLPFGVVVVDRELKINDWNTWMDRWSGIPRAETQGRVLTEFFPDLMERGLVDKILSVFETECALRFSYRDVTRLLNFDPKRAPKEAVSMLQDAEFRPLFDAEAEVAMVYIIVDDVTDHVLRLQEVENLNLELASLNEELTKANQVKGEFLQTTSHELRTPLTAILGFVDLLENDMAETPDEEIEFLGNIKSSASHLLDLINDILMAAKLQSRKIELSMEAIDLADMLTETHALLHPVAMKNNLHFSVDLGDLDVCIYADYQRFKQVLYNVVGNALKFTEEGNVRMSAYLSEDEPGCVVVDVTDTGIGIAPDKIALVFEQFCQADPSATRRFGGTGLGMPIAKSLMEHMNGSITISSPGLEKGATVLITIPLADNTP